MATPDTDDKKKTSPAGCAIVAVLALGLGAYFWFNSPDPTTTATPGPTPSSSADGAAVFADMVRLHATDLTKISDTQIDDDGRSVCIDVTGGVSLKTTAQRLMRTYSATDAGIIIGLAPASYCPSYEAQIEAAAKAL